MGGGGGTPLPYDAEIEYLESTGTQWIETGVNTVVGNLTFEVKYQFPNGTSGYKGLGYTTGSQAQAFYGLNNNEATGLYACFGNNTSSLQKQMSSDKTAIHVFKVEIINSVIYYYLDGSLISSSFTTDAFTLPKFTLFGFTNNNGALISGTAGGKMYYARLMNNGTTLFDVIPVRIGQTGYLYDRANARFFSNNGTGDFVLGSDKN